MNQRLAEKLEEVRRGNHTQLSRTLIRNLFTSVPDKHGFPEQFAWFRLSHANAKNVPPAGLLDDGDLARVTFGQADISESEAYLPLQQEPELYLEFASVGNQSFKLRDGNLKCDVSEDLGRALELTRRFGILGLNPLSTISEMLWSTSDRRNFSISALDVLVEARVIAIVLLGHKFSVLGGQKNAQAFTEAIASHWAIEQASVRAINKKHKLTVPISSNLKPLTWAETQKKYDHLDEYQAVVADTVSVAINDHLEVENVRYGISRPLRQKLQLESGLSWDRRYGVSSLRGAIWVQVANHVLNGAMWKNCENATCDRGIFKVDSQRSRRLYCDDKCKEQQNNRDKYKKRSQNHTGRS